MKSWRELISKQMEWREENWSMVEACTLSHEQLDEKFDNGYGLPQGKPFTLWTKWRVYFPSVYDGSERADSVPRHPIRMQETAHVGGQ